VYFCIKVRVMCSTVVICGVGADPQITDNRNLHRDKYHDLLSPFFYWQRDILLERDHDRPGLGSAKLGVLYGG
jgi:hypothetical protein